MDNCLLRMLFLHLFLRGIQSSSFCRESSIPTINICIENIVLNSPSVLIDTVSVPQFQQTSCECIISSSKKQPFSLFFIWRYHDTKSMKFHANDIFIDDQADLVETNMTGDTMLLLLTGVIHQIGGACLGIYTENWNEINISCKLPTHHSSQAPTSPQRVTRAYTSLPPVISTKDKENEGNRNLSTVITLSCVCVILLVIIACILVYVRRLRRFYGNKQKERFNERKQKENEQTGIAQISGLLSNGYQGQPDINSNKQSAAIISINGYERLNIYENDNRTGGMYQQLEIA